MATIFLTAGDDARTLINPGTWTIDGLAGFDTMSFGTSLRSTYTLTQAADGAVRVDSISGASAAFHATLYNIEQLTFDSGRDVLDVATHFGDTTTLTGTTGNDILTPGSGIKAINGGAGIDSVLLSQPRSAYQLQATQGGFSLNASDGSTTLALTQIERLQFSDLKLALDLNGHAGQVAKTLGAVFGASAVKNTSYVGIGLQYSDGGMSNEALMQLALDAQLGAGASHAAVVTLLYTNVVGSAPPAADLAFFTGLLDSRSETPASLGLMAADTALNTVQIDLSGLAANGLVYL